MALYSVDKKSDTPLYIQIRSGIEDAIQSKELKPGDKLPSVAGLAKSIGVTQATVRRALQDLSKAGHTYCHVGRGTFIQDADNSSKNSPEMADEPYKPNPRESNNRFSDSKPMEFAARQLRMGVGKALDDIMSLAAKPGIIHLTRGVPDPQLLPTSFLEEITKETLHNNSKALLEATGPLGSYELRCEIARRYTQQGTAVSPDQVLITNGSMQAITLVAQANIETGYNVLCETPCFKGITDTFSTMGHWVETIQRDEHGPLPNLPERLPGRKPFIFYLCPYAHNPMGTSLSKKRHTMLVDWAKKTGSLILADEIFYDLCFGDNRENSLMKELGPDQTIIVSSLSKSLMTSLRLGWLISSPQRIQQLAQLKRLMDHSCSSLIQGLAVTIFKSGKFDAHTKKMRTVYKNRQNTMLKALKRHMPEETSWTKPDGGFSLLVELPRGYSSIALFLTAIEKGISFLPGPLFDIDHRFVHCFRIGYAWSDEDQITEGIELLASAVTDFLSQPPKDPGLSGLGSYQ